VIAWARIHVVAGALVCVVLPAASYVDGSGRLAYTMFAEAGQYRVEIRVAHRDRAPTEIPATFLAARAKGTAGIFLAGAETFKTGAVHRTPRGQLDALAAFACTTPEAAPAPAAVTIVLVERAREGAPEERWAAERACEGDR
jgi:hypothetical protein